MKVSDLIDILKVYAAGENADCRLEFFLGDVDRATITMTGTEVVRKSRFVDGGEGVEFEHDTAVIKLLLDFEK